VQCWRELVLADNQGTLRDIANNAGGIQNHITYNSFGRLINQTNPNVYTRFNYTGREFDGESGLYYYRSRYYDCVAGRFISEDAIGFGGEDVNLYRYVGNSPTNFVDPLGQQPFQPLLTPLPTQVKLDNECVKKCIEDNLGLALTGATSVGLGQPFIPTRVKPSGMTPNTSPASAGLSKLFPQRAEPGKGYWAPTNQGLRRTPVLGRALGRWVPFVGWGLLVIDGALILKCYKECKEKKMANNCSNDFIS
jgi:RHS repeat-associated protein